MKHTEAQIIDIFNKVMNDLNFKYYNNKPIKVSYLTDIREYERYYPKKEAWLAMGRWFDEDYLGGKDNVVSIVIDDETGIADFFHSHTGHGSSLRLKIDIKGKYIPGE